MGGEGWREKNLEGNSDSHFLDDVVIGICYYEWWF